MTLQEAFRSVNDTNYIDTLRNALRNFSIVDVGYVTNYDVKNCLVNVVNELTGYTYVCEPISIGSDSGVFVGVSRGQYCLVFTPSSAISISTRRVNPNAPNYDTAYSKCLPIGVIRGDAHVTMSAGTDNITIGSKLWNISCMEDIVQFYCDTLTATLNSAGTATINTPSASVSIEQTGVTCYAGAEYDKDTGDLKSCKGKIVADSNGVTFSAGDEDGTASASLALNADGTLDVKLEGKYTLEANKIKLIDVIDGLAQCVENLVTTGSPATQSTSPATKQQIAQWRQNTLNAFTE